MGREKHLIDETSRVFCPVRGKDVDMELCLVCRRLEDFDLDSRSPYVVCRAPEIDAPRPQRRPAAAGA